MKPRTLLLAVLLTVWNGLALCQTPQAFKYQAIVRDATGIPILDANISLQIEIYTLNGPSQISYIENHYTSTNSFGLVHLEIGNGEVIQGNFNDISWGLGDQYISISIDENGGSNFSFLGSSQILSVPMASYAKIAGNVVDTSITNEIQRIDLDHNGVLSLSKNGGLVNLAAFDNSAEIALLIEKMSSDSLYFEDELNNLLYLINTEVNRALQAEGDLAEQISENTIQILSDSLHFQSLIDSLSNTNNTLDSLYFKNLIDANTLNIINDSAFLKSLIDQNTISIQQEMTRAILAEALNTANIFSNTQLISALQASWVSDSIYFQGLINQNTTAINAEITRAILAEVQNSNNININTQNINLNNQDIYNDSSNFQTQITQIDTDLLDEITRAIYRDAVNSDSIQLIYLKMVSDSIHFQTQINGLAGGGGLDPSLENGKIFVGNSSDVATGVNLSGDAIISNSGYMLINPAAITSVKVADGNITNPKLAHSSFVISDDQGHSGQLALGEGIEFHGNGATILNYDPANNKIDITSSDNQILNVNGNTLSITSGNAVDLSAIIGQVGPQGPTGLQGENGVGVQSTVNNGNGTFTINYTDGSTFTTTDFTGPQGVQGPQGIQGPQGTTGSAGADGADGVGIQSTIDNGDGSFTISYTDGSTFTSADLTGPQGVQGIQGIQGVQGPTGATGSNGANGVGVQSTTNNGDGTFTIVYTDGSTFTTADFTGPTGPQGPQGVIGPQGNNGVGILSSVNNGDGTFTINYTDGSVFTSVDLTGPQGAQGIAGPQGIQGVQGAGGPQGAQGIQGLTGNDGISINWLGTVWPAPASPNTNDAYRNPVDKKSYIWDGSVWMTITEDGAIGPQGPTGPQGPAGTSLKDCPAGDWSAINEAFCVEVNENGADNWWNAAKFCGDQNAHLCTWNEWYYVCQKSGSGTINMTNDWEWTSEGQAGGSPTATVVGNGSCTSSSTEAMGNTKSFRCCFSR